ncbi:MAG TPA: PKD domain-containing protein [Gemmatimonadaceae bacterium]|nr:PKD domain-containing protein [Gemmatimonadaceae bacterium]
MASLVTLVTCGDDGVPTSPGRPIAPIPVATTHTAAAITHTLLTSGNGTTNGKVYTTTSVAPAPNALVTVAVLGHRGYGAPASPIVTGGGMTTWEEVATVTFDPIGSPLKRLTIYRAMSSAPGSGPITITFAANVSNAQWIVSQWENVDGSGANGASAIGQTVASRADAGNGLGVALAALANANNVAYGVFGVASSAAAVTPGTGFTEIAESPSSESPPSDLQAEWGTNDNTIDANWVNLRGAALGIEIKAGAPPSSAPVATVTIDPADATVEAGANLQLAATLRDADGNLLTGRTVMWSTSDAAVATVSQTGLVNGVGLGTATITAMSEGHSGTATITVTPAPPAAVLVGAGDIADCGVDGEEQTAKLLDNIPGTVYTTGDNAYEDGTASDFANCYEPTWGRHKARTRPSPGNHDYHTSGASGYFNYFGENAGPAGRGYYSYDLGAWHIISLNSNISMSSTSAQMTWLKADLAANPAKCTLAYWHHPRFSSGSHGNTASTQPLYQALYDAGAEVVLAGHDHHYERFAPQTATGVADPARGIRQFVVGTGGRVMYSIGTPEPNSEVRQTGTWGVLQLTLRSDGYDWKFVPVAGKTFTDQGSGTCHDPAAPAPNQPPVAQAGGPYRSEAIVRFDGRASADPDGNTPLTYAWNFGDGTTGTGATPSHTYAADGVYNVTLVVTDALGAASQPTTATATVANIPPVVSAGPNASLFVGQSLNLNATFSDAGGNDGPWTYTIDWGDGQTSTGTALTQSAIAASHVYASVGTYTVRVTVTDKDGGAGSGELTATVSELGPATITSALLTSGNSTSNGKVYTTTSIAPAPNALVLVAVVGHRTYGAGASPIITGGGMTTWEEVATVTFDPVGSPLKRITLYRAMSTSPGSGPVTITFPNNVSNAQWIVTQWEGVDVSGTNGSGAIVQMGSARADGASGLAVMLAAFESASNAAYGVFGVNSSTVAITPTNGFTEFAERGSAESPPSDLQAQWKMDDSQIVASWANLNGGALGVEIRARTAP